MATQGTSHVKAKLVLLGDMGAGKSSLVMRFVKGQFFDYQVSIGAQESTVGAAFFTQALAVNETMVTFEIWDTAGQERYHSLAPMYYRGAAAAIVVYDMTNPDSFVQARKWVDELQRQGNPNMVIALAGNKADLSPRRQVEPEVVLIENWELIQLTSTWSLGNKPLLIDAEGQAYADEYELLFMETSAKTSHNVNELFYKIAQMLPDTQQNPAIQKGGMMILTDRVQERAAKQTSCCS